MLNIYARSSIGRAFSRLLKGYEVRFPSRVPFFETRHCPEDVALQMIDDACINPDSKVLEPSAGRGGISDLLYERTEHVTAIELHGPHFEHLKKNPYRTIRRNFLTIEEEEVGLFTHIVSCPPFDTVNHLNHMKTLLEDDGVLIALVMGNLLDDFWLDHYTEMKLDFKAPDGRMIRCGIVKYLHTVN